MIRSTSQVEEYETQTLAKVVGWLDVMTPDGRARVLRYLGDKYGVDGVEVP